MRRRPTNEAIRLFAPGLEPAKLRADLTQARIGTIQYDRVDVVRHLATLLLLSLEPRKPKD